MLKNFPDLRIRNRLTMVADFRETLTILFREDIAIILHGENLRHFNINYAHAFGKFADDDAGILAQDKLAYQH